MAAVRSIDAANSYLFGELRFHGSEDHYYDPRNSCLNHVLEHRTGIPITLSLVYMEVARRLAKPVYGINAPGHFLIQFDDGATSAYIDPYHSGRVLNRDQCLELAGKYSRNVSEDLLPRATPRQILVRMLRNLEGAYVRMSAFEKAVVVGDFLRSAGITPQYSLPSSKLTVN